MNATTPTLRLEDMSAADIRKNLIGVIFSISVAGVGFGLTFPLLSLIMEKNQVDEITMGLNAAMFALAALTFSPFVPQIMARLGIIPSLVLCLATVIVCLLLFKTTSSMWVWFPARYIAGAALACLFVITEIWVLQLSTDQNRARLVGLYGMCMAGGFAMGPAVLILTGPNGWLPFIIGATIVAAGAIPLFIVRNIMPRFNHPQNTGGFPWQLIRVVPLPMIAAFTFGALENSQFNFLTVYGLRTSFFEENVTNLILALALGGMSCQVIVGWFGDNFDKRKSLIVLGVLSTLGAIILPNVIYMTWAPYIVVFFWGGVTMGLYTISLANIGDRLKGAELASGNALLISLYGAGSLIGPPITGTAMDYADPHGFAYFLAFIAAIFTVFALVRLIYRPSPQEP